MCACSDVCIFLRLLQEPAFAESGDELGDLLRQCKDVPQLDMFSDESRMDVPAALVQRGSGGGTLVHRGSGGGTLVHREWGRDLGTEGEWGRDLGT